MASRNLIEIIIGARDLTAGELDKIDRRIEKSAASWRRIGYASVGAGTAGLASMTLLGKSALTNADNVNRASKQLGMLPEDYQRISYAAMKSDSSIESVTKGILRATVATVGAAKGNKTYQAAFKDLGVSYLDSAGKARSGIDVVMDMAEAFHQGNISAEMLVAGLRTIGLRAGKDMIPFLKEGREQLEQWMADAPGVISNETIGRLDDFGKAWESIGIQMKGAVASFTDSLLPTLTKVQGGISGVIEKFNSLPGSTKASIGQFALLGSAGLVAAGNLMILGATIQSAIVTAGALKGITGLTVAIAGMTAPLFLVVAGFFALWSIAASVTGLIAKMNIAKEKSEITKKASARGYYTSGELDRWSQLNKEAETPTKWSPMQVFKSAGAQMADMIGSFTTQAAGAAAAPISSYAIGGGNFALPEGGLPGVFAGGVPTMSGGGFGRPSSGFPNYLPPSSGGGVNQVGQTRNVNFYGSFDTTADGIVAMDDLVEENM